MDAPATVRTEQQGPVLTITLDRPERRNAVDGPTALALRAAFEAFEADDSARVAVLTGAGGHFCAGADLQALGDPAAPQPDRAHRHARPARWGRRAWPSPSR